MNAVLPLVQEAATAASPLYVAVVPVFRHSVLVVDALDSLLAQRDVGNLRIVVVDDGCPHPETRDALRAFAAAHPRTIHCVRQHNRGLSGARNTGIEIALAHWPHALGIYFLDADNRLEPWALDRVREGCASHPEADWFFPDIIYFGLKRLWDGCGDYDPFEHLAHNYCEAGSFVRMKVFAAGVRFDETMKLGYEDWDFWLQALGRGFTGRHLPDSGFRYRKRGESMLSDSDRDRPEILGSLRRKHRRSFSPGTLLGMEAQHRPRSCFIDVQSRQVRLGLDPLDEPAQPGNRFDVGELALRLAGRGAANAGQLAIFATEAIWHRLAGARLLPWALREIEVLLAEATFVALRIADDGKAGEIEVSSDAFRLVAAQAFTFSVATLLEMGRNEGDERLQLSFAGTAAGEVKYLTIRLPKDDELSPAPPIARDSIAFVADLRLAMASCVDVWTLPQRISHRLSFSVPVRACDDWHGLHRPFPRIAGSEAIDIGFVLPIGSFGGVERVAHHTAIALKARGHRPHLLIAGSNTLVLPAEFAGTYDTIRFSTPSAKRLYGWNEQAMFIGSPLPLQHPEQAADLAGLCADLDVVINSHSAPFNYAMSILRRAGISTCCTQHVFDQVVTGRLVGPPIDAVAFEHAYDLMLPVSDMMAAQLHALGVPRDKLLRVRNAGGIVVAEDRIGRALAERRHRSGPLRCIFLGRLDRQKGIERLSALIETCRGQGQALEWRIVGKAVVGEMGRDGEIAGIPIEPPVFDASAVADCLAWADVVVMPSLYEGLPLLAFDAMAMGCILLASDVGATAELVSHGETGFLLPAEGIIKAMAAVLQRLAGDPAERLAMAERAVAVTRARSWQNSVDPLAEWIERRHRPKAGVEAVRCDLSP